MFKIDLHLHNNDDPIDYYLEMNSYELIDYMAKKGYDIISISLHEKQYFNEKLNKYAKKKGILLIPGIEKTIEGCDVLLYNFEKKELNQIKKLKDIRKFKTKDRLVIAPHPYYIHHSLGKKLEKNIDLFDAIEFSHFYTNWFTRNNKAKAIALFFKKTLIGNSDAHFKFQIGKTYSLIDCKKNMGSVFDSIKNNQIKIITKPLTSFEFFSVPLRLIFYWCKYWLKK